MLAAFVPTAATAQNLDGYVDPFDGTAQSAPDFGTGGGAGNTFPGAVVPFGMLSFSPETVPSTVNFAAGYSYGDSQIDGFSLTHLSGAGCAAEQDIPLIPTTAPVTESPAEFGSSTIQPRYVASFSHADERASPGYYQVQLNPASKSPIDVQLTATTRAGMAELTYPTGTAGSVLIDPGGSATADTAASVQIDPATQTITGSASSGRFCYQQNHYTVYFAAQFDRPFSAYGTWTSVLLQPGSSHAALTDPIALNYTPIPGGPSSIPGNPSSTAQAGGYVTFEDGGTVGVRVGISYVSTANARQNLEDETAGKSFAQLRIAAQRSWNQMLGAITVRGGSLRDRRMFYTALYHALLEPSVFSDANGQYLGMDGQVHAVQRGHTQYANYSGWDIYRSEIPLLAMLLPARTSDMVTSLLNDQQQSGWLPKWPTADGQTNVMVGDSADPIIAGAWAYGARDFDTSTALAAMLKGATQTGTATGSSDYIERPQLADYLKLGYVPHDVNGSSLEATLDTTIPWGSASTTLEYATDDFTIAQFARSALCDTPVAQQYMARSGNWQHLWDPSIGYVEPRDANGAFVQNAGPTETDDFTEGDAAQYTWAVPYDLEDLFARMGGTTAARARLDHFFAQLNTGPASSTAFLGNEPTLETPWEYDWLGQPDKTEATVRRALLTLYNPSPSGYPGNDDLGEMSSWYVLSALGLYPEIPGTPILALGSPLFPSVTLRIAGHTITITAPGAADGTPYVRALTFGRHRWTRPWLTLTSLTTARTIRFALARQPTTWGASTKATAPSYPPSTPTGPCEPHTSITTTGTSKSLPVRVLGIGRHRGRSRLEHQRRGNGRGAHRGRPGRSARRR